MLSTGNNFLIQAGQIGEFSNQKYIVGAMFSVKNDAMVQKMPYLGPKASKKGINNNPSTKKDFSNIYHLRVDEL